MNRRQRLWSVPLLAAWAAIGAPAAAAPPLSAPEAPQHVGEQATVCGTVVSTRHAPKTKGQPTFLNFDVPYPHHIFTVVIWGSDRPAFGTPETTLMGRRACVTGTIQLHRGTAEIIVSDPRMLTTPAR
jgi:hypothetical protein